MAEEDKLMGYRDATPVYGSYRIDIETTEDIRREIELSGSAKSPDPELSADTHPVKDGFQRKIIVEDEIIRDEIQSYLDEQGINYTTEDISPTQDERDAIRSWGAEHGIDAAKALEWKDAVDSATSVADLKEVEMGRHPDTGEEIERPKGERRQ